LPNQLNNDVKKQRSQQLHVLANDMKLQFCRDNLGHEFPVLWEGYNEPLEGGKQKVFGYTPNYLKVSSLINNDESVENKTITTRLIAVEELSIFGKMLGSPLPLNSSG
jgi:threonylcarbamoyladenosine tRNA methylthiotransferase MtaB